MKKPKMKLQGSSCQNHPAPSRARGQKQIERDDIEALYAEFAKPAKSKKPTKKRPKK